MSGFWQAAGYVHVPLVMHHTTWPKYTLYLKWYFIHSRLGDKIEENLYICMHAYESFKMYWYWYVNCWIYSFYFFCSLIFNNNQSKFYTFVNIEAWIFHRISIQFLSFEKHYQFGFSESIKAELFSSWLMVVFVFLYRPFS